VGLLVAGSGNVPFDRYRAERFVETIAQIEIDFGVHLTTVAKDREADAKERGARRDNGCVLKYLADGHPRCLDAIVRAGTTDANALGKKTDTERRGPPAGAPALDGQG
jgi:hypothetical protein